MGPRADQRQWTDVVRKMRVRNDDIRSSGIGIPYVHTCYVASLCRYNPQFARTPGLHTKRTCAWRPSFSQAPLDFNHI